MFLLSRYYFYLVSTCPNHVIRPFFSGHQRWDPLRTTKIKSTHHKLLCLRHRHRHRHRRSQLRTLHNSWFVEGLFCKLSPNQAGLGLLSFSRLDRRLNRRIPCFTNRNLLSRRFPIDQQLSRLGRHTSLERSISSLRHRSHGRGLRVLPLVGVAIVRRILIEQTMNNISVWCHLIVSYLGNITCINR